MEGTEANPESAKLWQQLGRLYSDPFKPTNYQKAAEYFEKAAASPLATSQSKREYFYTLMRVPQRQEEAWELGQALFAQPSNRRFPSIRSSLYTLNLLRRPELAESETLLLLIFQSKEQAYLDLVNYWQTHPARRIPARQSCGGN